MDQRKELQGTKRIHCNMCGKQLRTEAGLLREDAFEAIKEWGFFSERDLEVHRFTICEQCYNELIKKFKIPVEITAKREAL